LYERSGGFAGISTSVEIDSKTLSDEEQKMVRVLIDQSGFFDFNEIAWPKSEIPDRFQYKITIAYKDKKETLEFSEPSIPDSFGELINYLTLKARNKRRE
jgi:hypothetical protein